MRIIRQESPEEIEVKCSGKGNRMGGCGAVLGVTINDVYHTSSSDYRNISTTHYYTVCCPQCFGLTDLDKEKITVDWSAAICRKPAKNPEEIIKITKEGNDV